MSDADTDGDSPSAASALGTVAVGTETSAGADTVGEGAASSVSVAAAAAAGGACSDDVDVSVPSVGAQATAPASETTIKVRAARPNRSEHRAPPRGTRPPQEAMPEEAMPEDCHSVIALTLAVETTRIVHHHRPELPQPPNSLRSKIRACLCFIVAVFYCGGSGSKCRVARVIMVAASWRLMG